MAEKGFLLRVVTPECLFIKDLPVLSVEARGVDGDFGAMPGHEPFLTMLKPGSISYRPVETGEREDFHCDGGIIEVLPYKVSVLAESARRYTKEELAEAEEAAKQEAQRLEKQIAELKAEMAKSPEMAKKKAAELAEQEKLAIERRKGLASGELWLQLPVEQEGTADDIARLEVMLTKSLSQRAYIEAKRLGKAAKPK